MTIIVLNSFTQGDVEVKTERSVIAVRPKFSIAMLHTELTF